MILLILLLGILPPEWARHAVWYQIFPERFHNADPSNDPTRERIGAPEGWAVTPWTSDWYSRADWEQKRGPRFRDFVTTRRYGGDLQGVIDKLDYLKGMGVTALYLNPIFDAVSLHKYDASSYHHIDRHFGPDPMGDAAIMAAEDPTDPSTWQWTSADRLFLELLRQAKARGMRVVIDGVFNHTGRDFWAFRDLLARQRHSPYKDWYEGVVFDSTLRDGFDYKGWWGYKGLPELKEEHGTLIPPVRDHIFAITRRWMDPDGDGDPSDGIDGWRLDVAEDVGIKFWREWHALVRSVNPQALTIAEIWTDKARDYIAPDLFDVVMNYRFAYAAHEFFITRTRDAASLAGRIDTLHRDFPMDVNLAMQNLYDSHDTERLASMVVNRDHAYKQGSKIENPTDTYQVRKPVTAEWDLVKLMAFYQFTSLGAPMVYYGTETGMWGADDPDDRKPMIWPEFTYDDEVNHPFGRSRPRDTVAFHADLHAWYSQLGAMRRELEPLRTGVHIPLYAEGDVIAFERRSDTGRVTIVINRGETEARIRIGGRDLVVGPVQGLTIRP